MPGWTIISNYGLVLHHLWNNPRSTAREIASVIKTTEWTARKILADLEDEGYIAHEKDGRNNVYRININVALKHDSISHVSLGNLLETLKRQQTNCN